MKQKIYVFTIVLICLIALIPNQNFASISSSGYTIESYDIDMIVNENNSYDITETISANFTGYNKHGIFRKIPIRNTVTRLDGTKSRNRAKISNISVSDKYTASNKSGYKVLKIGDKNQTVFGRKTYTIKYNYNIGKDPLKNVDELYYNLIGDEWDTNIRNVTFKITMPKSFNESLLGFSSGYKGSTDSSNVSYIVDGNVIRGSLNNTLREKQALTVRLTLPEGYFADAKTNTDIYLVAIIIISLVFVLIADQLWIKYGKDDVVVETVEFYPPEGYNSAEVGFLYEGKANTSSVISLLIYLANKGYLKIEEIEEKGLFKKSKGFRITKLKEYDGNNENERIFFEGLFKGRAILDYKKFKQIKKESKENGEEISVAEAFNMATDNNIKNSVTDTDLYNNFYITLGKIKNNLNSKENKKKIFESLASGKTKWLYIMIIALFVIITTRPIIENVTIDENIDPFLALILRLTISSAIFLAIILRWTKQKLRISSIITALIIDFLWIAVWIFLIRFSMIESIFSFITYVIAIISIISIAFFIRVMTKRTAYGNEMLGKLRGFKRFLETAEKSKLETLVEQNPEYFYHILPYTYALGVSDVWISQFETIALQAPKWYSSTGDFNMHSFGKFMTTTMASASTAMSSRPSSSSGGGSSGGGSGGGGGGSW